MTVKMKTRGEAQGDDAAAPRCIDGKSDHAMPENLPTELLDDEKLALWTQLRSGIEMKFGVAPVWSNGGKKWDVECKYRKGGKTLCAMYAGEMHAGLLVIFGAAEREKFEAARGEYPAFIRQSYDSATTYHDGKWVMFDLADAQHVPELLKLLGLKRKPVK